MPEYIDTHAHTNFEAFDGDRGEVYARARAAGISLIVEVGVGLEGSRAALALARREPLVRAAAGLHPTGLGDWEREWEEFEALVRSGDAVAVGECGLDYHWMKSEKAVQGRAFRKQIALAREVGLPFLVHCREAEEDLIAVLRDEGYGRGVVHCFGGSVAQARALLALGLHISFCGNVTFPKNGAIAAAAAAVPLDRLLLETDSPFLAPVPRRGRRNEPAYVAHTAAFLAALHGVTVERLAEQTTRNAHLLFALAAA